MAFICNVSRHLVGKEWENIVVMMVARTMEAIETGMMRLGATVALRSALVDVGMACSAMVPRVTAATRHLESLAGNSSDAKLHDVQAFETVPDLMLQYSDNHDWSF